MGLNLEYFSNDELKNSQYENLESESFKTLMKDKYNENNSSFCFFIDLY